MNDVTFAGGGYLLLVRYAHQQRDMVLVAKLNAQAGAIFSEDLHRVIRASYLNLDRLQVAARIDVGSWLAGDERYLSFVLKKDKDDGPSDYFQDFVGCRVDQDSKVESRKLVRVVRDFATSLVDSGTIEADSLPDVQRRAFDYATALRRGESHRMDAFDLLANAVWPDDPDRFVSFLNSHEDPPSAGFVPDPTTMKKLSNIDFKSRDLSVKMTYSFKQQHVRIDGQRIVIEDAPQRLLQELTEG
jgi:nucleoid-associated protein YejK